MFLIIDRSVSQAFRSVAVPKRVDQAAEPVTGASLAIAATRVVYPPSWRVRFFREQDSCGPYVSSIPLLSWRIAQQEKAQDR